MKTSRLKELLEAFVIALCIVGGAALLILGLVQYNYFLRIPWDAIQRFAIELFALGAVSWFAALLIYLSRRMKEKEAKPRPTLTKWKIALSALIIGLAVSNAYLYVYHIHDYGPPIQQCHDLAVSAHIYAENANKARLTTTNLSEITKAIVGNLSKASDIVMSISRLDKQGQDNLTRIAMDIRAIRDHVNLTLTVLARRNETLAWQTLREMSYQYPGYTRRYILEEVSRLLYWVVGGSYLPSSLGSAYKVDSYYRRSPGYYPEMLRSVTSSMSKTALETERWAFEWLEK